MTRELHRFRAEVAAFDREAEVGTWAGPRHRMTYRTLGFGRPLVLVPGLASTYRGHAPTLRRLALRFRTVEFDYPGDRDVDGARLGRITHDDLVDDLFGMANHLGLERPALFGLSLGSTIVFQRTPTPRPWRGWWATSSPSAAATGRDSGGVPAVQSALGDPTEVRTGYRPWATRAAGW